MGLTRAALLLALLSLGDSGCKKPCEDEAPGFLLEVTAPPGLDPAKVGCLLSSLTLDGRDAGTRTHEVAGKLGDGRTSIAFVNVAPAGARFALEVTVTTCETCQAGECHGPLATTTRAFAGEANACNVFGVQPGGAADAGPDAPRDLSGAERRIGDARDDRRGDRVVDLRPPFVGNRVFITSVAISPGGLVAKGGGAGPLAGGDALCKERAAAAGLPGNYKAWLSTSSVAAYTRLGAARGWSRLDGRPFADTVTSLVNERRVYFPVALDETGTPVGPTDVMTATGNDGKLSAAYSCKDWASTAGGDHMLVGVSTAGSANWSGSFAMNCDMQARIYCFQIDHNVPITISPAAGRRVFLGSLWSPAGGLAGADSRCQANAQAAGLPGTYFALLASASSPAASRLTAGQIWVRTDGIPVEAAPGDLASNKSIASIDVAADGKTYGDGFVWTGASSLTTLSASHCVGWTSTSSAAQGGYTYTSDTGKWFFSRGYSQTCDKPGHLYCLQR